MSITKHRYKYLAQSVQLLLIKLPIHFKEAAAEAAAKAYRAEFDAVEAVDVVDVNNGLAGFSVSGLYQNSVETL